MTSLSQINALIAALESGNADEVEELLWKAFASSGLFQPSIKTEPWREPYLLRGGVLTKDQARMALQFLLHDLENRCHDAIGDRYVAPGKARKSTAGQGDLFDR